MSKERADLRRGLRALIQQTSEELKELTWKDNGSSAVAERGSQGVRGPGSRGAEEQGSQGMGAGSKPAPSETPVVETKQEQPTGGLRFVPPSRQGVCWAYYVNPRCWELGEAFCNRALHICMLRNCPVYKLHRENLERRFAEKYKYLW